jgi:Maltokinase N-terminal cap domain
MALIYETATLTPGKLELLSSWLPGQSWYDGQGDVEQLGSYRFDDPAGEVGVETFLLRATDGSVLHVPLTYRSAELADAADRLVGTTEHSVLGTRWVYDAATDPVWAGVVAAAVLGGGTQVEEVLHVDGRREPREPSAYVSGSGTPGTPVPAVTAVTARDEGPTTVVRAGDLELVLVRVVGAEVAADQVLTGTWPGGTGVLVGVRG